MSTHDPAGATTRPYHHGSLKAAMLQAAERILRDESIAALTLRRAAREVGASHAAPRNHFGDLAGLLSELAAIGFRRFSATMQQEAAGASSAKEKLRGLGRGYIRFARENPALFLLMFRSDRLNHANQALGAAGREAFEVLTASVTGRPAGTAPGDLSLEEAAAVADAWAQVHGLSMLLIDGRLTGLLSAAQASEDELIEAALSARSGR